jgi:hypothetical protein
MPKNYTFVSKGGDDWASVMIKDGKYEGIIYHSGHNQEDLESSVEFKNTLGDILVDILDEQLEAGNLEYND